MPSAAAALGLLPALALACVLASNWAAGGAPMEALQVRGGEPLLVDIEPDAMRVVGELAPVGEDAQQLKLRFCGTECTSNMRLCIQPPSETPGRLACREMMVSGGCPLFFSIFFDVCCPGSDPSSPPQVSDDPLSAGIAPQDNCRNVQCKNPDWERYVPCWEAARADLANCAGRSGGDPHCKMLFINHVNSCR